MCYPVLRTGPENRFQELNTPVRESVSKTQYLSPRNGSRHRGTEYERTFFSRTTGKFDWGETDFRNGNSVPRTGFDNRFLEPVLNISDKEPSTQFKIC